MEKKKKDFGSIGELCKVFCQGNFGCCPALHASKVDSRLDSPSIIQFFLQTTPRALQGKSRARHI